MAVLENIRSKLGILVSIIIGIALLAFILTDFIGRGRSSFFGDKETEIAKIAGKSISYKEFLTISKTLTEIIKFQTRRSNLDEKEAQKVNEQAWQQLVDETVLDDELNGIGLEVSRKELLDIMQGTNPHPLVRYLFTNPETQQFDRSAFTNFARSLNNEKDPGRKAYWLFIENQIKRERLMMKFNNIIKNGLYVTSEQTKQLAKDNNKKVSFNFIVENLNSISDSLIHIKESDLENYYKKHLMEFEQQQPSRNIEYITYDIVPSQDDFEQAQKWIDNIKNDFMAATDIKSFVNLNSDTSFVDKYLKESELPDTIRKFMFSEKIGAIFGPYFTNNSFNLARLADIKNLPDSIRIRQIVVKPDAQTEEAVKRAEFVADSLKNVLKKGGNFAVLVQKFSQDASADKGGDIGWVKEDSLGKLYNECFFSKKGEILFLRGQTGFHVVEVREKGKEVKKVQVGILVRRIEPSDKTIQTIYQKASVFVGNYNTGERFDYGLKKQGIEPVRVSLNTEMKTVPGLDNSRELIRWTFDAELNAISDIKQYGNKFVISHLTQVREKGTLPFDQVRDQIILSVKKEKKLELLTEKIKKGLAGVNSIENLSSQLQLPLRSATDIGFNSYVIPNVGYEPSIVATAVSIAPNKLSSAIQGNDGVFVLFVTSVNEQEQIDPQMFKMRVSGMYSNRINYSLPILIKLANITDNRIKFL